MNISHCIINWRGGKFLIVGCATAWNEAKGLIDYIALSKVLRDDCQIVLVGASEQIQSKLPPNIIGIPKTDSVDMLAHIYSMADVVTSLSYAETFGMTIVEGMACGTPVIAYDNTAQRELIDEHCGFVVPTGNIDALSQAINKIKANGKAFYSEECVRKANTLFNINERYNEYIKLYKELCNSKN